MNILGLRRSGNHAVINWILGHYDGAIHYNNCYIENNKITYGPKAIKVWPGPAKQKLYSFEDLTPEKLTEKIIILRDPFNTFASRFQRLLQDRNNFYYTVDKKMVNLWKNYATQNCLIINFNKWLKNLEYRKELSKNFGIFTDKNKNYISEFTLGSSFDNYKFQGKAQEMNLENRWRIFRRDKFYRRLVLDDPELHYLSKIKCEFAPDEKSLL